MTVEKLIRCELPKRVEYMRVIIMELARISDHLICNSVIGVDTGPDARTGLIARVRRDGAIHEVALADLRFAAGSVLGLVVAAYRRWQGRNP